MLSSQVGAGRERARCTLRGPSRSFQAPSPDAGLFFPASVASLPGDLAAKSPREGPAARGAAGARAHAHTTPTPSVPATPATRAPAPSLAAKLVPGRRRRRRR